MKFEMAEPRIGVRVELDFDPAVYTQEDAESIAATIRWFLEAGWARMVYCDRHRPTEEKH